MLAFFYLIKLPHNAANRTEKRSLILSSQTTSIHLAPLLYHQIFDNDFSFIVAQT